MKVEAESFLQWFPVKFLRHSSPRLPLRFFSGAKTTGNAVEEKATCWLMRRICKRLPECLALVHQRRVSGLRIPIQKKYGLQDPKEHRCGEKLQLS